MASELGDIMDKAMGLDLLMNPKKRAGDNISVISSRSSVKESDISSLKSVQINPYKIDVSQKMSGENYTNEDDDSEETDITLDEDFSDMISEKSYVSRRSNAKSVARSEARSNEKSEVHVKHRRPHISEEEIISAKREILYQFDRMEKKGMRLPRKFTMASSLDEMKSEYDRLRRDRDIDTSVKFNRKTMITVISGLELLNNYFDPLGAKLDGWSENINENIEDYDDIFEDLHEKYKGKAKMSPEVRLLMMLGGSAFMFHMSNTMFKTQAPGLDEVLKQNPELAKQFAAATANTMRQKASNPIMSGIGGIFSSMFGGGDGAGSGLFGGLFGGGGGNNDGGFGSTGGIGTVGQMGQNATTGSVGPATQNSQPIVGSRPRMKGPTDMEDILKEMEMNDNFDRIEMMSTVTESEFADDQSLNNLLMNRKKKGGRKINLNI